MGYPSLEACVLDLERHGRLVRVHEDVDPRLEMAAIHLRVHERGGPALLFERVRGCRFRAASNLFGTLDRARFLFRDTLARVQALVELKYDPVRAIRRPLASLAILPTAAAALPQRRRSGPIRHGTIAIRDLPQIVNWPNDGGPFITLPQVYTEDVARPGRDEGESRDVPGAARGQRVRAGPRDRAALSDSPRASACTRPRPTRRAYR
jgi:4-hydroxy-3-polyprenylbenzoate decarboxylase